MPILDTAARAAVEKPAFAPAFFIWIDAAGGPIRATTFGQDVTFTGTGDSDLDPFQLIANGTFATVTTGWTPSANASLSIVGAKLRVTSVAGGSARAYQAIATEVGQTYTLTVDVTAGTAPNVSVNVGTTSSTNDLASDSGGGSKTILFTATTTTSYVQLINSSLSTAGQYNDFDNVSIIVTRTFTAFEPRAIQIGDVSNSDGGSETLTVDLSGIASIDADLMAEIADTTKWQGRIVRLWFQLYDESGVTRQGAIVPFYTGYASSVKVAPSPESQLIRLEVENYLAAFNQASNRSYLNQKDYDSNDNSAQATIAAANMGRGTPTRGGSGGSLRGGGLGAGMGGAFGGGFGPLDFLNNPGSPLVGDV